MEQFSSSVLPGCSNASLVSTGTLPELRRWGAQDHRGDPGAAGDREDPQPPGTGSTAVTQGSGARCGARLSCLICPGRKQINTGHATQPRPGRRCATWRLDAARPGVNPEVKAETASCERSRACRNRPTRGRRHQTPGTSCGRSPVLRPHLGFAEGGQTPIAPGHCAPPSPATRVHGWAVPRPAGPRSCARRHPRQTTWLPISDRHAPVTKPT